MPTSDLEMEGLGANSKRVHFKAGFGSVPLQRKEKQTRVTSLAQQQAQLKIKM